MRALLLGGQIITFLAIVAVSVWGRKNVHTEARIPARLWTTGWDYRMSKHTTLVYTPVIGSLIVMGTLAVGDSVNAEKIAAIGLAILVMFLMAHWSSVRRAAR